MLENTLGNIIDIPKQSNGLVNRSNQTQMAMHKLSHCTHIMRPSSVKKSVMVEKVEEKRRRGQRVRWVVSVKVVMGALIMEDLKIYLRVHNNIHTTM